MAKENEEKLLEAIRSCTRTKIILGEIKGDDEHGVKYCTNSAIGLIDDAQDMILQGLRDELEKEENDG